MKFFYALCLSFLLMPAFLSAQNISTEGDDFWIGFMENWLQDEDNPILLEIYISADDTTQALIEIPGMSGAFPPLTITVVPGRSSIVPIPTELAMVTGTNTIQNKAVHITTEKDVSVFAMNKRQYSADMAVILPTYTLGNNYFVMSHWEDGNRDNNSHSDSEFVIVSIEDNTRIEIIPSVSTKSGDAAGIPITVTLNEGQCFQVQAAGDLTGSIVRAVRNSLDECKRFAVFAGNKYTKVGQCNHPDGHDHLYSQMYPLNTWGKEYISVSFLNRTGGDYIKVLAGHDSTKITINGIPMTGTDGEYFHTGEFLTDLVDGVNTIASDKPVSVAQFSRSQACDGSRGDPFQIMLNPTRQVIQKITFYAPEIATLVNFDLSIIAKTSDIETVILDNNSMFSGFIAVPGNEDYSYARILIQGGNHTLKSRDGIIAYVYGYGSNESFGYATGAGLGNINLQITTTDQEGESIPSDSICHGTPFNFAPVTEFEFSQYTWNFGDGKTMTSYDTVPLPYIYEKPGRYLVTLSAKSSTEECAGFEELSVQVVRVLNPVVSILGPRSVCPDTEEVLYWIKESYPYQYSWFQEGGSIASGSQNDSVYVDWGLSNPMAFVGVVAEDSRGCVGDSVYKYVKVKNQLEPDAPFGPDTLCSDNLSDHLYTAFIVPGTVYTWEVTNGTFAGNTDSNQVLTNWNSAGIGSIWFTQQSLSDSVCSGISDTLEIYIQKMPEADLHLASDRDVYGIGDPVYLDIQADSLYHYINWDFGDGRKIDLKAIDFIPGLIYPCEGTYRISTYAADTAGICDASSESEIQINVEEPELEMINVTHEDFINDRLFVHWARMDSDYYKPVYLYRSDPENHWIILDTLSSLNIVYMDTAVISDQIRYLYILKTNEDCGSPVLSDAHNNILLEIRKDFNDTASTELRWNDYIHWQEGVWNYEIWLSIDEQPYEMISGQGSPGYFYTKQNSGFEHCFAVKAIENKGSESYSWSNTACVTLPPDIFPYNVITPNGDAKNETFVIRNIEYYPNSVLSIYNRWGKKITEFRGYQNNWTGTDNGETVPNATYFYILELNEPRAESPNINGMISVLR
ncbi:MAG TPA: gliding motility-associated C-terminal domain-containing protein [Cyclobacteriaceae bacterium]|nr:gliding motility-associated C-terminal domain-containing protein [Cyclobacteriaceae bacterium]